MKIPLVRGRWFTEPGRRTPRRWWSFNETAARRFWCGEDPIGKPIALGFTGFGDRAEAIGIVGALPGPVGRLYSGAPRQFGRPVYRAAHGVSLPVHNSRG